MEYEYEAVGADGRAITGRQEANSPADIVRRLSGDGLTVVGVTERRPPALPTFRRRLRAAEVIVALRELATLLGAGVALAEALEAQSRGGHHPVLLAAFVAIGRDIARGESFRVALRAAGLPLPDYVHQLVEAGELSGQLPGSLREAVAQLERDERVVADTRSALAYPAVLVVFGLLAVALVFLVVVPKFVYLLEDAETLPFLAWAVLAGGAWFSDNPWLAAGVAAGVALAFAAAWRNGNARERLVNGVAKLPLIGDWYAQTDAAKWASVMAAMLTARVDLMDALALAARGVRIARRQALLDQAVADVKSGVALSDALEKRHALTPTGYGLVRVGERSGTLPEMMRALAELYGEHAARRMKRVLALIEPLAILLIGGALGTIMVGLMLAILSANELGGLAAGGGP